MGEIPQPSLTAAFEFSRTLSRLDATSACADLFREAIAPYGFDTFASGELDLADRERNVFYLIDWPDAWRRFYIASGLIERDPLVHALATHSEPFTWSELRADGSVSAADAKTMDSARAFGGWVEGLVVPVSRSGRKVGLVSLVGRNRGVAPDAKAFLSLISLVLHEHVRGLVSRKGFAAPPAGLTPREIECLTLVAGGKSDREISQALSIAAATAHEHIENAKRKLKADSRAETVAVAVSLGIIEI
ncbi:MAG TPA: LuxR family transcriptional regulator [Caulobacteraceae bacterium]|nr:LuxR family transcriptional regulator [Caulobacteraceae bacterium]